MTSCVDGAFDDADGAGEQLGPFGGGEDVGWGEVDEVVGPLANDLGVADRARAATDDAELPVGDLVAVAVGAVQDVAGPPVAEPGDVGQLVVQAGRDDQRAVPRSAARRRGGPRTRSCRRAPGR